MTAQPPKNTIELKPLHIAGNPEREAEELIMAINFIRNKIEATDVYGARAENPLSVRTRIAMEKIIYAVTRAETKPQSVEDGRWELIIDGLSVIRKITPDHVSSITMLSILNRIEQHVRSLREKAARPPAEDLKTVRNALEFYAKIKHRFDGYELPEGEKEEDWTPYDRDYFGQLFVEDGAKAKQALAVLDKIMGVK